MLSRVARSRPALRLVSRTMPRAMCTAVTEEPRLGEKIEVRGHKSPLNQQDTRQGQTLAAELLFAPLPVLPFPSAHTLPARVPKKTGMHHWHEGCHRGRPCDWGWVHARGL